MRKSGWPIDHTSLGVLSRTLEPYPRHSLSHITVSVRVELSPPSLCLDFICWLDAGAGRGDGEGMGEVVI